jgi:hypothetical protein
MTPSPWRAFFSGLLERICYSIRADADLGWSSRVTTHRQVVGTSLGVACRGPKRGNARQPSDLSVRKDQRPRLPGSPKGSQGRKSAFGAGRSPAGKYRRQKRLRPLPRADDLCAASAYLRLWANRNDAAVRPNHSGQYGATRSRASPRFLNCRIFGEAVKPTAAASAFRSGSLRL